MSKDDEMDWYAVLGCTKENTKEQLSKAARKLALKYHPDKNPDPLAVDTFQKIQKAKDFLTDDTLRKKYDEKLNTITKRKEYDIHKMQSMDSKRKRMREELESRLHQIHKETSKQEEYDANDTLGMEKARRDGMRRREESKKVYERNSGDMQSTMRDDDKNLRRIKVKWRRSRQSHSDDTLFNLFGRYGNVEDIVLTGAKGNSALIQYSTQEFAKKAVDCHKMDQDMRVSIVGESKKNTKKSAIFIHTYEVHDDFDDSSVDFKSNLSVDGLLTRITTKSGAYCTASSYEGYQGISHDQFMSVNRNSLSFKEKMEGFATHEREILSELFIEKNVKEVNILLSCMKTRATEMKKSDDHASE